MKFDKILEYQKADSQLVSLENDVTKSREFAQLAAAKAKLDAATESINKLAQEAAELLKGYDKMKGKTDELKAKLDEFDGIIEGIEDSTEADYYLKQVAGIDAEIQSLEKNALGDANKTDAINAEYKRTWESGIKASDAYKTARLTYEKYLSEIQPKANEIKAVLSALKKEIPDDIMELYKSHRQPKKMPVFVECDSSKDFCGGCHMELANDTKGKLCNSGDYAVCPNCNRVLFVP